MTLQKSIFSPLLKATILLGFGLCLLITSCDTHSLSQHDGSFDYLLPNTAFFIPESPNDGPISQSVSVKDGYLYLNIHAVNSEGPIAYGVKCKIIDNGANKILKPESYYLEESTLQKMGFFAYSAGLIPDLISSLKNAELKYTDDAHIELIGDKYYLLGREIPDYSSVTWEFLPSNKRSNDSDADAGTTSPEEIDYSSSQSPTTPSNIDTDQSQWIDSSEPAIEVPNPYQ